MSTFRIILEYLPGIGIHTDLLGRFAFSDVERIAQAAATLFMLQLFINDFARKSLQGNAPSFLDADLGILGVLFAPS